MLRPPDPQRRQLDRAVKLQRDAAVRRDLKAIEIRVAELACDDTVEQVFRAAVQRRVA